MATSGGDDLAPARLSTTAPTGVSSGTAIPGQRHGKRRVLVLAGIAFALATALVLRPDPWTKELQAAARGATRLRLRTGGTCHRRPDTERVLVESTDSAEIDSIVRRLRVSAWRSWTRCMCCGDATIEIYRGDTCAVQLSVHHGKTIRWPDHWSADGVMTADSARFVVDWLSENGLDRHPQP